MLFFTLFWSSQNSVFPNLNVFSKVFSTDFLSQISCYIPSQKITSMKPIVHCHKAKNVTFCSSNSSVITRCNNNKFNDSEQCIVHCSTRSLIKVTEQHKFLCLEPASALFLASYKLCNRCVCSSKRKKPF